MKSIIPRDDVFFDMFEKLADLIVQGIEALRTLLEDKEPREVMARRVKTFEHEADEIVHQTMEHLHRTFVTPLDRGDIRKLVSRMDDILDLSEAGASRIELYQPKVILKEARDLVDVLHKSGQAVNELIGLLRDMKKHRKRIEELCVEINRLENDADVIRRAGLGRVFQDGTEVLEVIKWKDILEHIEAATDRCEDVADVVVGIVLENT